MKNKLSKVGAILVMVVTFIINLNLASCVSAPRRQYSSNQYGSSGQPSSSCGQSQYGGPQRPDPRMMQSQNMGPQVPSNMPGVRQSDWKLGHVLHERWHYDPRTGKVTKVGGETLQPGPELDTKMRESGLDPFPNRIPIGGTMPSMGTGTKVPGNPPPLGNEGAMNGSGDRQPPARPQPPQRPVELEEKTSRPPAEVFPEIDPATGQWLRA